MIRTSACSVLRDGSSTKKSSLAFHQADIIPPATPATAPRKTLNGGGYFNKANEIMKNNQSWSPVDVPTELSGR